MMRVARVVPFVIIGSLALAARSQAQTPAAAAAASSKFFVAGDVGATFGHKSSGSYGAEGGMRLSGPLGIYGEFGHMNNVGTEELDQRATNIANSVGATASTAYKVTFFDAGIRYAPQMGWKAQPYLMTGFGVASVEAETVLSVNGTAVPPESLGVQFGNDLNGTVTKTMFVIGGGAMYPLSNRYFVDGSFRYGRIFPKTSEIDGDTGINTLRAQVGFGISF